MTEENTQEFSWRIFLRGLIIFVLVAWVVAGIFHTFIWVTGNTRALVPYEAHVGSENDVTIIQTHLGPDQWPLWGHLLMDGGLMIFIATGIAWVIYALGQDYEKFGRK